jgi:hypothetical protein
VPFAQVEGTQLLTIEGLGDDHPLTHAFMDEVGAQCGICTPGIILAAVALGEKPSLERMRAGLAGNLCRCTGYEAIYRAIGRVGNRDGRRETGDGSGGARGASSSSVDGASRVPGVSPVDGVSPEHGASPERSGARRPGDGAHRQSARGGPPEHKLAEGTAREHHQNLASRTISPPKDAARPATTDGAA